MAGMRERAVLILGAGVMQLPAIRAARTIGVTSYVVDGNNRAPGVELADSFEQIDLKAADEIVRYAEGIPDLSGVFTAGTDFSTSVAQVTEQLGLTGPPYQVALDASDKGRMRRRFSEAGVPSPRFRIIGRTGSAEEELRVAHRAVGLPGVVKPVDNMGARGVRLVRRLSELPEAVENARSHARDGVVIYEEWIDGEEYSIDALVYRGEIIISGVAVRHIQFEPYFVEMGHTLPAQLSPEREKTLIDTFEAGIRALGIDNGAAKGDIFLRRGGGGTVGEIAARLSGGYMSGWTYPYATGVPLTEAALRLALGEDPRPLLPERKSHTSVERAIISIPGRVRRVEGVDSVRKNGAFRELFLRVEPGDPVAPPRNNVEKCGNLIVVGETREKALSAVAEMLRELVVRLEPNREESDRYLFDLGQGAIWAWYPELFEATNLSLRRVQEPLPLLSERVGKWGEATMEEGSLLLDLQGWELSTAAHCCGFSASEAVGHLLSTGIIRDKRRSDPISSALLLRAVALGGVQAAVYIRDSLLESRGDSIGRWLSIVAESKEGGI